KARSFRIVTVALKMNPIVEEFEAYRDEINVEKWDDLVFSADEVITRSVEGSLMIKGLAKFFDKFVKIQRIYATSLMDLCDSQLAKYYEKRSDVMSSSFDAVVATVGRVRQYSENHAELYQELCNVLSKTQEVQEYLEDSHEE